MIDKQKQELQIKELKSNRSLAIVGIVITSVILFFLGIFTLVCLTWRVSSKLGAVDYLLIFACFFVLFLLILCIRAVFKANVKLENFLRNEDEQNLRETQTGLNVLPQKNNILRNRILISLGIVFVFLLIYIAQKLDII